MSKYRYNHSRDADSICEVLQILATADALKDCSKVKALGELADMVSQGMKRLQKILQQKPVPQYQLDSSKKSANASTSMDSEGPAPKRGWCKQKEEKKGTVAPPKPPPFHVAITVTLHSKKTDHITQVP